MGERVGVVGLGLVGGSLGAALRRAGHDVVGHDRDPSRAQRALDEGIVDRLAGSVAAASQATDVVFVCVPVGALVEVVLEALEAGQAVVTDVGSVKASIVEAVEAGAGARRRRFVGGHPMAGSEQEGLAGADPDLFEGATWVLTPTEDTSADVFTLLRGIIRSVGAEVVAVDAAHHDVLVATVSHVPHLAAGTLMLRAAREAADDQAVLLRLAAGGFRDMTRIASGHPGIWPDICVENRDAIVAALDGYLESLTEMRDVVAAGDRDRLLASLESAREARTNLPIAALDEGPFVELRVPVPDRPGVLAEVTTLAGQLDVNIADLEIAHSMEGPAGVLVVTVPEGRAADLEEGLARLGYHSSRRAIE